LLLPHWESPRSEAKLLYIKRSVHLTKHAGQIAFPGGVAEVGDGDLLTTGFREGAEEVGLRREHARVLGPLPSAVTPSGYSLQPYFVATTQSRFIAQESEVESIVLIELEELLNCPVRVEQRTYQGKDYRVVYFDTRQACVWGVTGRITEFLLTHFFDWQPPE
jgi:8-oxo-dGTP pyrophosphatase MutT (NUDIX family)